MPDATLMLPYRTELMSTHLLRLHGRAFLRHLGMSQGYHPFILIGDAEPLNDNLPRPCLCPVETSLVTDLSGMSFATAVIYPKCTLIFSEPFADGPDFKLLNPGLI